MAQFEPNDEYFPIETTQDISTKTSTGVLTLVYVLVGVVCLMSKWLFLFQYNDFQLSV